MSGFIHVSGEGCTSFDFYFYIAAILMIFYGPSGGDKGIEKSKLKNWNFKILIADSDSLQKSMNLKWSSFFYIQMLS